MKWKIGSDLTGDKTTTLHATAGLHLSEDDPHMTEFHNNINSARCTCESQPMTKGPFKFLILNNKYWWKDALNV